MKYFFDTEFIEGFKKPLFGKRRHYIDLISIGIVAEDGREYYAISNEYNYNDADDWVKKNVIDRMYIDTVHGDRRNICDATNFHKFHGKSNKQIQFDIFHFVHENVIKEWDDKFSFAEEIVKSAYEHGEQDHEFYAYYADYDWVLFCSLFGRMIDLPVGFPMYCRDLKQSWDRFEQSGKVVLLPDGLFNSANVKHLSKAYPKQENKHNALDDARWNLKLFEFLIKWGCDII